MRWTADWTQMVKGFCTVSCTDLGLPEQVKDNLQLCLCQAVIIQDGDQYETVLDTETTSWSFARTAVFPLSSGMVRSPHCTLPVVVAHFALLHVAGWVRAMTLQHACLQVPFRTTQSH